MTRWRPPHRSPCCGSCCEKQSHNPAKKEESEGITAGILATHAFALVGTQYIVGAEFLHVLLADGRAFAGVLAQGLAALHMQVNGIPYEAHPGARHLQIVAAEDNAVALAAQLEVARHHLVDFALLQGKNAAAFKGVLHLSVGRPLLDHLAVHEDVRHEHTVALDGLALVRDLVEHALLDDPARGLHDVGRAIDERVLQMNQILGYLLLLYAGVNVRGRRFDLLDRFCKRNV